MITRRLRHIFISLILTLSLTSTHLLWPVVEGRMLLQDLHVSSSSRSSKPGQVKSTDQEEKMMMQLGSHPPRCEGRCRSCGHCEAVQVPTNSQHLTSANLAYARGDRDYYSNYKPMSWKCKCGTLIFNP